jgi:hypothetical protein
VPFKRDTTDTGDTSGEEPTHSIKKKKRPVSGKDPGLLCVATDTKKKKRESQEATVPGLQVVFIYYHIVCGCIYSKDIRIRPQLEIKLVYPCAAHKRSL